MQSARVVTASVVALALVVARPPRRSRRRRRGRAGRRDKMRCGSSTRGATSARGLGCGMILRAYEQVDGSDQIPDQAGRTAVVTGANSGLGLVTARELARAGARVVATARDEREGRIRCATRSPPTSPEAELEPRVLDLADLGSVREFAAAARRRPSRRVDLLVNNAGVMMPPRERDRRRLRASVRHQPPRPLRAHRAPARRARGRARTSRVVTVSSLEHRPGQARLRRPAVGARATRPAAPTSGRSSPTPSSGSSSTAGCAPPARR